MGSTFNSRYDNRVVVSTKQWLLTFFILLIPIVNLIMLFVWAFGRNVPKSKENWARACLIVVLLMLLIGGSGWAYFFFTSDELTNYISFLP